MSYVRSFLLSAVILGGAAPLLAELSSAEVTGVVRDATGSVVASAAITLRNVDTSLPRHTQSNSAGNYAFVNLPPGSYTLETSAPGFKTATVGAFTLSVNQSLTADVTLEVGNLQQTVSIEAQAAQVESATAELGSVIAQKQVTCRPTPSDPYLWKPGPRYHAIQRFWNLDFSLFRQFPIREGKRFELRAEAFNVLNTVVWGLPGGDVSAPNNFGKIFSIANSPRTLQLAAQLVF